ncbi:50S ribosomal protein L32e [Candidatus Micrarchaeota archaeon]|nr:MAG: 50S ribosomal protein L32e [Candidatus Micrarchaeota archaeon]
MKKKKPTFKRQGAHRKKRVAKKGWRKPRGIYSHQRDSYKFAGAKPKVGYKNDRDSRAIHPSGLKEILVHNVKELKVAEPNKNIIRIASTVGKKKRREIVEAAEKMKLRVINPGVEKK